MESLKRIWQTTLSEWENALHSRRALMLVLLYVAAAVLSMYSTISVFGKIEQELAEVLKLPASDQTGIVSETLWRSQSFKNMISKIVGDSLVFNDILQRHPVELLYAWFAFAFAPLLVVLVSGTRICTDLRSGAARYMLVRVTRWEWTLGKYMGQALMIAFALAVSAFGAWCVAAYRLPSSISMKLLIPVVGWGFSAWIYSLSWLGVVLGVSHLTRSSGVAMIFFILVVAAFTILPYFVPSSELFLPSGPKMGLWRSSFAPQAVSAFHLITMGLAYLMVGSAVFSRRDV